MLPFMPYHACYDRFVAPLHQRACKLSANPLPPRGGPLLTSCCALAACACFQVNYCATYLPVCLALSNFPMGGSAPGLSYHVLLHACLYTVLAMHVQWGRSLLVNMSSSAIAIGHDDSATSLYLLAFHALPAYHVSCMPTHCLILLFDTSIIMHRYHCAYSALHACILCWLAYCPS
jgi:hypothetical protein